MIILFLVFDIYFHSIEICLKIVKFIKSTNEIAFNSILMSGADYFLKHIYSSKHDLRIHINIRYYKFICCSIYYHFLIIGVCYRIKLF